MAGAAKHKKEKSASVEASSEAEVDSAAEAAEVAEPAVQDGGMKTVTPEGEELETQAQIEAEGDHGGGAGFPYLEDLSATPPLPQAELALPPAEAMAGAPLFSAAAYLEPSPTACMPGSKAPVQEAKVEADRKSVV